jgi:hypothetical protein
MSAPVPYFNEAAPDNAEFQITLRRDPKKSIDFVKSMMRSTNHQMLNTMRSFCSQNKL